MLRVEKKLNSYIGHSVTVLCWRLYVCSFVASQFSVLRMKVMSSSTSTYQSTVPDLTPETCQR